VTDDIAKCPRCGHLTSTKHNATPRAWWCHECKMPFEPEDDGDISYGPPDRRMRREERRRQPRRRAYPSADAGD